MTLFGRLALTRQILARQFGVRFVPLFVLCWFAFVRLLVALGQGIDALLYPGGAELLRRPVLIAGVPRSGTTFLHRLMAADGFGAGSQLFRMVFPSTVLQKALRPILPALEWASPTRFHKSEAHDGSLLLEETDDALMLLRQCDGFLWYAFFLAWADEELRALIDPRVQDTFPRDLAWAQRAWIASARAQGRERVIIKSFAWFAQLPRFLAQVPDARVVVLLRDPARTIPSALSLVRGPLDKALHANQLPAEQQARHSRRLAVAMTELYRIFCEDWSSGAIDQSRVKVIPYPRLMQDFEGVMSELSEFLGHPISDALRAKYATIGASQRSRVSAHRYTAARFGLDDAQIRRESAFVYELFGPLSESSPEVT